LTKLTGETAEIKKDGGKRRLPPYCLPLWGREGVTFLAAAENKRITQKKEDFNKALIFIKKREGMSLLLFTFLFSHDPREESSCTGAFAFKFGKFCIEFLLFIAQGPWGDDFYPDQQVSGISPALHPFTTDL
jgi:hypothetical protein